MVLGQIAGGVYVDELPRQTPAQRQEVFALLQLHKSFGILILVLSLGRLGWRLTHPAPPLPAHMAAWEKTVAHATHWTFYALMIGVPLGGWALVSASPFNVPTMLFGQIPWPHLPFFQGVEDREATADFIHGMHDFGAKLMLALVVLHVGAALKHHVIDNDDVLARMLPLVRKRS